VSVTDQEAARRIERFTKALRSSGFRLTHQRLEVVREVASTDTHPDAEGVFESVRERVPTISLDTVYRTLGTLADLGLVSRVSGVTGAARYDANAARHHHFVCTRCGLIKDVEGGELDALGVPASAAALGQVDSVEVRFCGICRECER
jgi:Fur family transcriptional regulator, peroxide stress response regulator